MDAAILAVGSEMLGTERLDTNSLRISAALERYGIPLVRKSVVGDEERDIAREIGFDLEAADLVVITGGLGPTEDDRTREAVCQALGLELEIDRSIIEAIEQRFKARSIPMPRVNERQANVFKGQTTLHNDRGTAPGFHIEVRRGDRAGHVWIFPGVPHELEGLVARYFEPWLATVSSGSRVKRVLKIAGMTESAVEERLLPFYEAHQGEPVTILASHGQIEIHLTATGSEVAARERLQSRESELLAIFGERVYGFDDDTLEAVVGRILRGRRETVSAAESCTGGLVSSRITDVAGSSDYFMGGAVCYTADAKMFLAGVDPAVIQQKGEVSEEVARELAAGVRRRFHTTYGIGVTGIAGPGGGSEAKPVGTVHIAVADAHHTEHRKFRFGFSRSLNKWFFSQMALDLLRLFILRQAAGAARQQVGRGGWETA
jgi:nicotinamide-nucleotide amidase